MNYEAEATFSMASANILWPQKALVILWLFRVQETRVSLFQVAQEDPKGLGFRT